MNEPSNQAQKIKELQDKLLLKEQEIILITKDREHWKGLVYKAIAMLDEAAPVTELEPPEEESQEE